MKKFILSLILSLCLFGAFADVKLVNTKVYRNCGNTQEYVKSLVGDFEVAKDALTLLKDHTFEVPALKSGTLIYEFEDGLVYFYSAHNGKPIYGQFIRRK